MPGPTTSAPPMPRPMPGAAGGIAGGGMGDLAMLLGSLQAPEQQSMPGQQTTFPQQPMQMNPAFAQMIMQMLMTQQTPQAQIPALGQLMGA